MINFALTTRSHAHGLPDHSFAVHQLRSLRREHLRAGTQVGDVSLVARPTNNSEASDAEAFDWQGKPVSCRECPHKEIRSEATCDLGRICVRDRRARRIDRFFAANPTEAENYLDHPYFEARALAAKYASVFQLQPMLD